MNRFTRSFFVALAVSTIGMLGSVPARAQNPSVDQTIDTVLGDHTKYKAVIDALQAGVKNHDAAGVAALISYPIKVKIKGKQVTLKSAAAFVKKYDSIITPAIATVIETQKYDDLMVNAQGIMLGKGEVWINGICSDTACSKSDARVVTIQAGPAS